MRLVLQPRAAQRGSACLAKERGLLLEPWRDQCLPTRLHVKAEPPLVTLMMSSSEGTSLCPFHFLPGCKLSKSPPGWRGKEEIIKIANHPQELNVRVCALCWGWCSVSRHYLLQSFQGPHKVSTMAVRISQMRKLSRQLPPHVFKVTQLVVAGLVVLPSQNRHQPQLISEPPGSFKGAHAQVPPHDTP